MRNMLWRNWAGTLPTTSTNLSTSKYFLSVQSWRRPSLPAKSMPAGDGRRAPVDKVRVEPGADVVLDDALAGLEVEDVRAVDQREDEEHRRLVLHRLLGRVAQQLDLVLLVDDLGRRTPLLHVLR